MADLKEVIPPVVRTGNQEIDRAWIKLIEALKEIYRELKRLESAKQDA